jgi:hypothetical protein
MRATTVSSVAASRLGGAEGPADCPNPSKHVRVSVVVITTATDRTTDRVFRREIRQEVRKEFLMCAPVCGLSEQACDQSLGASRKAKSWAVRGLQFRNMSGVQ